MWETAKGREKCIISSYGPTYCRETRYGQCSTSIYLKRG